MYELEYSEDNLWELTVNFDVSKPIKTKNRETGEEKTINYLDIQHDKEIMIECWIVENQGTFYWKDEYGGNITIHRIDYSIDLSNRELPSENIFPTGELLSIRTTCYRVNELAAPLIYMENKM